MQIEIKLKRILPILLALLVLWGCFVLSVFLLGKSDNKNHQFVPKNAQFVLRLDANAFFQTAVYDVFFAAQDNELIQQIQGFTAKNKTSETWNDAGIDLFSDVICFQQELNGENVTGFLFNLIDSKKFIPALSKTKSANQFFAVNESVGLLFFGNSKTTQEEVNQILAKQSNNPIAASKTEQKIIEGKINKHALLGTGDFSIEIKPNELLLNGVFDGHQMPYIPWTLKSDGAHISYGLIAKTVQDTMRHFFQKQGFNMPAIDHISMNYRGTTFGKETVLPDGEFILHCAEKIERNQFLQADSLWRKWGFVVESSTENTLLLLRENKAYTLKFLDAQTLFFGSNTQKILPKVEKNAFLLEGDLSNLTEINGGGLGVLGLSFYPPYKASNLYFNSIQESDIQLSPVNGRMILKGKWTMKNQKLILPELLRFLLTLSAN